MNKTLILVVEDDKSVQNLMVTTLKTHEYRYLTAMSGETAILETSSHNPDIILLDLGLPDMPIRFAVASMSKGVLSVLTRMKQP